MPLKSIFLTRHAQAEHNVAEDYSSASPGSLLVLLSCPPSRVIADHTPFGWLAC